MKRLLCVVVLMVSLFGCGRNVGMNRALQLRNALLQGSGCEFQVRVTADYGKEQYVFSQKCAADSGGNLSFSVQEPETISGISGKVTADGGTITFDDDILAFPVLAEGTLTPVGAPWIFLRSLRSGFISVCDVDSDSVQITIQDSYQSTSFDTYIYCNSDNYPYYAELFWEGQRIITLEIGEFKIL